MSKIYTSADQLIGHTPLLELTHIEKEADLKATVLAKLEYFNPACTAPVCYNGDVTTVDDLRALEAAFPELSGIMVGRGLIADPALLRKAVGGPAASREELRGYHDELYHGYTEAFGMASCAVSRMKAHWFYLIHLFDGADVLEKPLRKAREGWEYETVVNQIFACWPK